MGRKHKVLASIVKDNRATASSAPSVPPSLGTSTDDHVLLPVEPPDPLDGTPSDNESNEPDNSGAKCQVCHQTFPSKASLAVHFSSHPIEANQARVDRRNTRPANVRVETQQSNSAISSLSAELDKWFQVFDQTAANISEFDATKFNLDIAAFQTFLYEATNRTPGPVHPSTTYYRLRQKKQATNTGTAQAKVSNPQ